MMSRAEAFHILDELYEYANEQQKEALHIAQQDIEFCDLMIACPSCGLRLN